MSAQGPGPDFGVGKMQESKNNIIYSSSYTRILYAVLSSLVASVYTVSEHPLYTRVASELESIHYSSYKHISNVLSSDIASLYNVHNAKLRIKKIVSNVSQMYNVSFVPSKRVASRINIVQSISIGVSKQLEFIDGVIPKFNNIKFKVRRIASVSSINYSQSFFTSKVISNVESISYSLNSVLIKLYRQTISQLVSVSHSTNAFITVLKKIVLRETRSIHTVTTTVLNQVVEIFGNRTINKAQFEELGDYQSVTKFMIEPIKKIVRNDD